MNANLTGLRRSFAWRPAPLLPDLNGHTALAEPSPMLVRLREQRDAHTATITAQFAAAEADSRDALNADEQARYDEAFAAREPIEARIAVIEDEAARTARAAAVRAAETRSVQVLSEPRVYDDVRRSYFLDLARDTLGIGDGDGGVQAARDRLQRHAKELDVDLRAREQRRDEAAQRDADGLGGELGLSRRERASMFERRGRAETRVNPNRTDGQGGFFVPPLWIMDEYIDLPRFGRTVANLCKNMVLPGGTDSISLPKIATGTTTAVQTADAAAVSSTDLTDTSVTAGVRTIAGQQDIALQLLDQSPIAFDEVVFNDLIADYNMRLDIQVISGTGSAGQMLGILNAGGTLVTYTDATPTLPELWVPLLQSASKVATLRKLAATGVVVDPRVWYWSLSQLDTATRPLLLGDGSSAQNTMGTGDSLESDGPAGRFTYGLPAFLDGNIPSNLGAGTNESRIITARFPDLYLWEGSMRTRVLPEVLSGTMQVRLQVYNYAAFMPNRRPESIAVIGGTGLIPATGF